MNKIKKVLVLSSLSAILPFTIVSCTNETNDGNGRKNNSDKGNKPNNNQKSSDTSNNNTKLKKDEKLNDKANNINNNKQEDDIDIIDSKKLDEKTIKSIENQYLDLIENKAISESFFIGSSLEVIKKLNVKNYKKFVLEAVKRDGGALQFASEELKKEFGKNRDIMLEVVKWNGNALRYASEELKKDREVVLEVMKRDYRVALQYASKELWSDKDVVLEAVKRDYRVLQYASKELWSDKDVVLEVMKQYGDIFLNLFTLFISDEMKKEFGKNRDIMLEAVKRNGYALQFASEELKKDKDVVLEAVNQVGDIFLNEFTSDELKKEFGKNRDIMLEVVKWNGYALEDASDELKKDKEFISKIIKINPYIILSFIHIYGPEKIQLDSSLLNILYSYKTLNFIDFNYIANISEYKEKNQNKINLSNLLEKVVQHTPSGTYKYEDLKNLIDKSNEDKQNLISILVKEPDLLKYIPYQFSNDKEFISLIAKQNKDIIKFASRRLQYDEEFINSIKNN
ncbi:DUF4116 domain-containing protein [Mycoplasmopsis cynos]|nr:DUF4116 domain-containing protein [Mycoplasmopsis cynos]